ncbi:MAG: hypothetical protein IPP33_09535 [Flavobacteriales bacterium]|nr:hypothetical protein [Flavobacteriales bacterium]
MSVALSGTQYKRFGIYVRRADQTIACPATDVQGFAWSGDAGQDGVRTFNGLQPGDHLSWSGPMTRST